MAECLFCKIAQGEVPAQVVYQDDTVMAFRDIKPQAPVHVLVIPKQHVPTAADLAPEHAPLLAAVFAAANHVATAEGLAARGYRLVFNVGADAGMAVPHLHLHVLGGRRMAWPPG